jgi:hypothetical protein
MVQLLLVDLSKKDGSPQLDGHNIIIGVIRSNEGEGGISKIWARNPLVI